MSENDQAQERATIEPAAGEVATKIEPVEVAADPINHTQQEEVYELTPVAPPAKQDAPVATMSEIDQPESPAPEPEPSDEVSGVYGLEQHLTGAELNTTAGQLDYAIQHFISHQEENFAAAKLSLINRIGLLEQEATDEVRSIIAKVRAAFK